MAKPFKGDPRHIVTEAAFRVRPELLGAALATPWRRGLALLTDLCFAAVIGALGVAGILAALAALAAYRLVASGKRGLLRGSIAGVLAVFSFAITLNLVQKQFAPVAPVREARSEALAAAAEALANKIGEQVSGELLVEKVSELNDENTRLREELESPSLLRIVRATAEDVGLTFGWIGLYFTLLTAFFNGSTPGKRLFRIRARRLDGKPFSLWLAFERFGGYAAGVATGLLGFAQIFWDANRQAIHDRITGTVVTLEERGSGQPVYAATVDQALEVSPGGRVSNASPGSTQSEVGLF
ncbi:MAG: RDD family protein [Myxococcota bacterium]